MMICMKPIVYSMFTRPFPGGNIPKEQKKNLQWCRNFFTYAVRKHKIEIRVSSETFKRQNEPAHHAVVQIAI